MRRFYLRGILSDRKIEYLIGFRLNWKLRISLDEKIRALKPSEFESFRALTFFRLEIFLTLKSYGQIGVKFS